MAQNGADHTDHGTAVVSKAKRFGARATASPGGPPEAPTAVTSPRLHLAAPLHDRCPVASLPTRDSDADHDGRSTAHPEGSAQGTTEHTRSVDPDLQVLAKAVRRIADDAEVSRGALDALTRTVEHQLDRVTEARRAIEGLAAIVERQRLGMAADREALDRVGGDIAAHDTELQSVHAAIERLQRGGRQRDDELARCQNAVRTLGTELERSVREQATGRAALEAAVARLESGRRDQRVAAEQTALEVDRLAERLQVELAALRADQAEVTDTLRDELARSVDQVDLLTALSKRQAAQITRLRSEVKALQEQKATARTPKRATAAATATPATGATKKAPARRAPT